MSDVTIHDETPNSAALMNCDDDARRRLQGTDTHERGRKLCGAVRQTHPSELDY
jgi:hypothetical protein